MAQQDNTPRKTGTATVTVASKLPHGLMMKVYDMVEVDQLVMGGGMRRVKEARPREVTYRLNGNSVAQNRAPGCEIIGGFALTHGIPRDFWDMWLSQHKDWMAVKNGLIFAHDGLEDARAESTEKKDLRSNLERINPNKLPRGLTHADELDKDTRQKIEQAA